MKRFALLPFLLSAVAFQPSAHAVQILDAAQLPQFFNDALVKEKKVKKTSTLKIEALDVSAKISGKVKSIEAGEDFWYVQIDAKTETPIECYVFKEFDGPANSMTAVIDNSLNVVAEANQQKLSSRFTFSMDSGLIEATPYIAYETLYTLGEGDSKTIGLYKAASARTDNLLQICTHNEVGYRKTFAKVFEGFVNVFAESAHQDAFFQRVTSMSFNNMPIGFLREAYTEDKDGDVHTALETTMMLPVDSSALMRTDSKTTEWSFSDGSLINAETLTVTNSTLEGYLTLQANDGEWRVKGQLQGKDLDLTLAHSDWLLSSFGSYAMAELLLQSDQPQAQFHSWAADVDPSQALVGTYSKLEGDATANMEYTLGALKMAMQVDEVGAPVSASLVQGPMTISLQETYRKGSPTAITLQVEEQPEGQAEEAQ